MSFLPLERKVSALENYQARKLGRFLPWGSLREKFPDWSQTARRDTGSWQPLLEPLS